MRNIPSKDELISYIKKGKKTIIASMFIFVILFAILYAYSIYTNYQKSREEEDLFLSQEEVTDILNREPQEVSVDEVRDVEEALEQNRYSFGVLIERQDQSLYTYPNLIREFLVSEEVVNHIQESIGKEILPSPEHVVVVTEDSQTRIQEVIIGTADEEDNILIAQAYFEAFQEDVIAPLNDKNVYMMDQEPLLIEEETWLDLVHAQIQLFDPLTMIIGIIMFLIIGFIIGIIIVLLQTMRQKEIPFLYSLEKDNLDKVLYLNHLKVKDEEQFYRQLTHTILNFPDKKKLILSENKIDINLENQLKRLSKEKKTGLEYSIINNIEDSDIGIDYDEVIILVKQNMTAKKWYENQRILLDRLNIPILIINY